MLRESGRRFRKRGGGSADVESGVTLAGGDEPDELRTIPSLGHPSVEWDTVPSTPVQNSESNDSDAAALPAATHTFADGKVNGSRD
jgi:hypothetical protein